MPYVGGSLVSLFDEGQQSRTRLAMRRMVRRGTERMKAVATINTPVQTSKLRQSWYELPVTRTTPVEGYESGIASDVEYAPHVEYGTGLWGPQHRKYPILPKHADFLAWRDPRTGEWIRAKRVMHPGSPGNHMVAIAASVVESELESGLVDSILDHWARSIEAAAD
jgi:Bacteriophage HK97-gp10, putative tail-component